MAEMKKDPPGCSCLSGDTCHRCGRQVKGPEAVARANPTLVRLHGDRSLHKICCGCFDLLLSDEDGCFNLLQSDEE